MTVTLGRMTLPVEDTDAAACFYADAFGFVTLFDRVLPSGFRAVHIGPPGQDAVGLWLFPVEHATAPGHPMLVLYVDYLDAALDRLAGLGVMPTQGPVRDARSAFAHVLDLDGNDVVLVELDPGAASST
jgi:predicted enzyme related to lactoylglutathione lyase